MFLQVVTSTVSVSLGRTVANTVLVQIFLHNDDSSSVAARQGYASVNPARAAHSLRELQ